MTKIFWTETEKRSLANTVYHLIIKDNTCKLVDALNFSQATLPSNRQRIIKSLVSVPWLKSYVEEIKLKNRNVIKENLIKSIDNSIVSTDINKPQTSNILTKSEFEDLLHSFEKKLYINIKSLFREVIQELSIPETVVDYIINEKLIISKNDSEILQSSETITEEIITITPSLEPIIKSEDEVSHKVQPRRNLTGNEINFQELLDKFNIDKVTFSLLLNNYIAKNDSNKIKMLCIGLLPSQKTFIESVKKLDKDISNVINLQYFYKLSNTHHLEKTSKTADVIFVSRAYIDHSTTDILQKVKHQNIVMIETGGTTMFKKRIMEYLIDFLLKQ